MQSVRLLTDLSQLAAFSDEVCVVKNVISQQVCDDLIAAIIKWRAARKPNEGQGRNWWYPTIHEGTALHQFRFQDLEELESPLGRPLYRAYKSLFDAHRATGTIGPDEDFARLLTPIPDRPALDPLIFFYPAGSGQFRRHAHDARWQKTQVLLNITKPGRDYLGGETLVEMESGETVCLGADCFGQGDVFSFPYHLFHSVNPVVAAQPDSIGRISVLMPFHPRAEVGIRYG